MIGRRVAAALAVLVATLAATWAVWPRPAVTIRIERGGAAVVVGAFGRASALPETVVVHARGRAAKVRIENRDTTWQQLGLFGAAAGTSRDFTVPARGTYAGYCSAHPERGRIVYVVR